MSVLECGIDDDDKDGDEKNALRVQVSHLLFVDDTLVFCGPSKNRLMYLSWILMWFEAILGLRINLDKSELILVGGV